MKLYQQQKGGLIGIDIGSTSIKLLELTRSDGVCRIEKFAVVPLSEGLVIDKSIEKADEVASELKRILSSIKPNSRNIAFSVPLSAASVHEVKFDASREDNEIAEDILASLSKYTQLPLNEVRVDYRIQSPKDGKKEVEIVAAKNEAVDSRDDIFRNLNLTPIIATIETVAIENAFKYISSGADERSVALFDIGHLTTTMYVLKCGKIIASRELDIGGGNLTEAIQNFYAASTEDAESYKANGFDDPNYKPVVLNPFFERMGDKLLQSLNLHESNSADSISSILISGSTSNIDGLLAFLNEHLAREVNVADPFHGVQINPNIDFYSLRANASTLLVAFGLALSEVGTVVNLLPWRESIKKAKEANFIKGAMVGALLGVACVLGGYSYFKQVEAQEIGANQLILETTAKYQEKVDGMKDVSARRTVMIERMKLIQGLQTERPVLVSVLNATVSSLPDEMYLTAMNREGNSFTFQGKAKDATVVAEFLRKLKATGWYDFTFMNSFVAYVPQQEVAGETQNTSKDATYGEFVITADTPTDISSEVADKAKKAAEAAQVVVARPPANITPAPAPEGSLNQQYGGQPSNSSLAQSELEPGAGNLMQQMPASTNVAKPPVPQDALPMNRADSSGSSQNMIYSGGGNGI